MKIDPKRVANYLSEVLGPLGWPPVVSNVYDGRIFFSLETPDGIGFSWEPSKGCGMLGGIFCKATSLEGFVSLVTKLDFRERAARKYLSEWFYMGIGERMEEWTGENPILRKALFNYKPRDETEELFKTILIGKPTEGDLQSAYLVLKDWRSRSGISAENQKKWQSLILSKLKKRR